ncbi:MAG: class I SAM-dependent methyltransferase [Bacteroidetes bacterium]|nr:class I SAM-dependent methyltransferase [Bacteroidota bacterium]MDA1119056.1 class I SAM-dependent methyltransferase [Bacteroidota bacterium]
MTPYTTEIASDKILSDNPIHQRLLKAYHLAEPYINGNLLELGCGEGRGVEIMTQKCDKYLGVDKIGGIIERLKVIYPNLDFRQMVFPPFETLPNCSFNVVISFQVIEHIKDDKTFLQEIYRVLKPGGKAILTTPNIKKTLTRNPWHIREYTARQMMDLASKVFDKVDVKGITGSGRLWDYYEKNKISVKNITRFDVFNLQYRLPASILRIPYDIMNRINRNQLKKQDDGLVTSINLDDYLICDNPDTSLDLFCVMEKAAN